MLIKLKVLWISVELSFYETYEYCMNLDYITKHARKRLKQRTQISKEELALLLDKSPVMPPLAGLMKEYIVFYSLKDKKHFVALREQLTGNIISVWYRYFYENKNGKISTEILTKAQLYAQRVELRSQSKIFLKDEVIRGCSTQKDIHFYVNFKARNKSKMKLFTLSNVDPEMPQKPDSEDYFNFSRYLKEKNLLCRLKLFDIEVETVKSISIELNKIPSGIVYQIDNLSSIKPNDVLDFLKKRKAKHQAKKRNRKKIKESHQKDG